MVGDDGRVQTMAKKLSRRSFALLVGGVGAASVTAGAGTYSRFRDEETATGTIQAADEFPSPVRINCGGGEYTASDGTTFAADQYSTGGQTYTTGDAISSTTDDTLYQSERYGSADGFGYQIPVVNGTYDVRLHFAEIWWGADGNDGGDGSRVFDLSVEGTPVLSDYDIHAMAGHDAAIVEVAQDVTVSDDTLNIATTTSDDNAKISAIEVVPSNQDPSTPTPQPTYQQVDTTPSGSATIDTSNLVIEAAGADVWQNDDEYGALYEPDVSGDFTATVTVESQERVHGWSKAGIMVANDITAPGGSSNASIGDVFMAVTPDNGFQSNFDTDGDGYIDQSPDDGSTSQYPSQLRIEKSGNTFTCSYSIDGGNSWTVLADRTVSQANSTQDVGLAVTSHQSDQTSRVEFSDFTIS